MRQSNTKQPATTEWLNGTGEIWATASQWQREMLNFVSQRLARDSETLQQLTACQSVQDLTTIQSKWLQETVQDHANEATKVMEIAANHVRYGHERVQRH